MVDIDWKAAAEEAARLVHDNLIPAHRGAIPWRRAGYAVLFGNDGYAADRRSRAEVQAVRRGLHRLGIEALGFAPDPEEGYSWSMIVRSDEIDRLFDLVWRCWPDGVSPQRGIARREIAGCALWAPPRLYSPSEDS